MNIHKEYTTDVGGKKLVAQFTDLTNQADGSVLLKYGNTVVLATAVMSNEPRGDISYFPLSVEYEEKFYAAGQILGSRFMRREGRPSEEAVLSGRAIDRTLRPLFDHTMRNDVQIVITILSLGEDDPDVLAINAASLALATSDIPWDGPVVAIRMGKQNSTWQINPTYLFRKNDEASLDLLVCGKSGLINMIEAGAHEVSEETLVEGFTHAQGEIKKLEAFQSKIIDEIGKEKREVITEKVSEEIQKLFDNEMKERVDNELFSNTHGKSAIQELTDAWKKLLTEQLPEEPKGLAHKLLDTYIDTAVHRGALQESKRVDGRAMDEVRPLHAEAGGISTVLHGTGIFYRGGTHVLSALTLSGPGDSLLIDTMEEQESHKRFFHHYNFPPFSVGETGRIGGFNRRMIGHGALAEKALRPVIPPVETFPYTIRVVSEALASNGSTSMGSICASTLALMDGGVPITRTVAGIAMGLMKDDKAYTILTDIQGPEDHYGDMDLKVAGTQEGITAIQMDVKVAGVSVKILQEALSAARVARLKIIDVIEDVLATPRPELSPHAPRIARMTVDSDKIGLIIGSGGSTIKGIQEDTGVQIDIEDDGTVFISGSKDGVEEAQKIVTELVREPEVGERYDAEVTRITDFGAFARISKKTEGLVHISELAPFRIRAVTDVVSVGDTIPVIIKEIDERGRVNLSLKDVDPDFAKKKGVTPATDTRGKESNPPISHDKKNTK